MGAEGPPTPDGALPALLPAARLEAGAAIAAATATIEIFRAALGRLPNLSSAA
jgi:hypothetical protein